MSNISVALVVITIICFLLNAWPIGLITLGILIITKIQHPEKDNKNQAKIEELKKENEALRNELADQAVRHAMERAEKRKD